mgnify:CR=1 FL=1
MSNLNLLAFGAYPYIALAICVIGSWARFDLSQYTWKAGSSQIFNRTAAEQRYMRIASNLFHVGILAVLGGHFVGLLTPHAVYHHVISTEHKQLVAMVVGGFFGLMCLVGLLMLIKRRLTDDRVRANSNPSDVLILLVLLAAYIFHNEQHTLELLEQKNNTTNGLRKSINRLNMQIAGLSFLGETVMEWTDSDKEEYHFQRMVIDSTLCSFRNVFRSEQKGIDSLRRILANKESLLNDLAALYLRQKTLHRQIADRVPAIARKSADEAARKPKRKGFLGLFGKKEDDTPTSATAMLHSLNSHVIAEQNLQDRLLSEQTDRLAGRNAMLNRQLQQLIRQIDGNVQEDLQRQEAETASERERIFMQIGGLAVFALALLLVLFFVIHRDANRIGQYKRRTAELIGKQQESLRQNEALIASRKAFSIPIRSYEAIVMSNV